MYLVGEVPTEQKSVPDVPSSTPQVYRALHTAIRNGLVRSAHDLSEGGLAVAAAEMCIGGRLGMDVVPTSLAPHATTVREAERSGRAGVVGLFTEVNGCLLVEVSPEHASAFENQFAELPITKVGKVTSKPILTIASDEIPVSDLVYAFNNPKHS